jgi:hypothetical protein
MNNVILITILLYIILIYVSIYYLYIDNEFFDELEDNTTNFVFTSAGDNTQFDSIWINNEMNYDVYVIYYGDDDNIYNKYKSKVKFIEKRKGSKFQNFKYFYDKYQNIINKYERFFIIDDDIIFNVNDINNMFKISKEYNLDICGPSFLPESKITYEITKHKSNVILTYTNFVEVNVPLFNRIALKKLMDVLDYSLIGWGIDHLYIICNGINKEKSYAIIHIVTCINPKDDKKSNNRELNLISNVNNRAKMWENFAKKHNYIAYIKQHEYGSIIKNDI